MLVKSAGGMCFASRDAKGLEHWRTPDDNSVPRGGVRGESVNDVCGRVARGEVCPAVGGLFTQGRMWNETRRHERAKSPAV